MRLIRLMIVSMTNSPPNPSSSDCHGWIVLDKPVGISSAKAVAIVRKAFKGMKTGHAGTLDPLASGVLPIALGEATKTISYVMTAQKSYEFSLVWGAETQTDDTEGELRSAAIFARQKLIFWPLFRHSQDLSSKYHLIILL